MAAPRAPGAALAGFLRRQLRPQEDAGGDDAAQARARVAMNAALRDVKTKSLVLDNSRRERSRQVVRAEAERKVLVRLRKARQPHAKRRRALADALARCGRDKDFDALAQAWEAQVCAASKELRRIVADARSSAEDEDSSGAKTASTSATSATKIDLGTAATTGPDAWRALSVNSQELRKVLRNVGLLGARLEIVVKAGGHLSKPLQGTVIFVGEHVLYLLRRGVSSRVHRIPLRKTRARFIGPLDRLGPFWIDGAQLPPAAE